MMLRFILLGMFFVLILLLCRNFTLNKLRSWDGPGGSLSNELYLPAIMWNAGHGFTITNVDEVPALRDFFSLKTVSLDIASVPDDITVLQPDPVHLFHNNLIGLVALTWHFLGISWDSVKIILIAFFFISAMLVFLICRLALPISWSCLVTLGFVCNESVLNSLFALRDFSKAPFILFVVLLLGIAIKHRLNWKRYIFFALLIGCCFGVGMGFRRDMQALLPFSIVLLCTCRIQAVRCAWLVRPAAALIMLLSFLAAGWLAISALYPERYLNTHDLIMGFATSADDSTHLITPASYEKHQLWNDYFNTLQSFGSAALGISMSREQYDASMASSAVFEREYQIKKAYVLFIAKTFPADMITRSYAAVMRIITGVYWNENQLLQILETFGFVSLILSLLIIAANNPRQAWQLVLFLCFFCGYTSLQYSQRHAFHMSFVCYFFLAFCFYHTINGMRTLLRQGSVKAALRLIFKYKRNYGVASVWLAITLLVFITPLEIARRWQAGTVNRIKDAYTNAERVPLAWKRNQWEENILFVPDDNFPCHDCEIVEGRQPWFRSRVLLARFKPGKTPLNPTLVYEWDIPAPELSGKCTVHTRPGVPTGYIDYYFVVHQTNSCVEWSRFAGLLLPPEQADRLEGFYEVKQPETLGGLFCIAIPENEDAFLPFQKMKFPWPHRFPVPVWPGNPAYLIQDDAEIKNLLQSNNVDMAIPKIRSMLERRPGSIQFTCLMVEALLRKGQDTEAHRLIDELIQMHPGNYAVYSRLDRCFEQVGGWQACYRNWKRIADNGDFCAKGHLLNKRQQAAALRDAEVLFEQHNYSEAEDVYKKVLDAVPESSFAAVQLEKIYEYTKRPGDLLLFWEELHYRFPDALVPALYYGKGLEKLFRLDEARIIYDAMLDKHPGNSELLLRLGIVTALQGNYAQGRILMFDAYAALPELRLQLVDGLSFIAEHLTKTGNYDAAESIYREIIDMAPAEGWYQVRYAESLIAQGNYNDAKEVLVNILLNAPESPYSAQKLDFVISRMNPQNADIDTWTHIAGSHPDAFVPTMHLGMAMERQNKYREALDQFKTLHKLHPDRPEAALYLGALTARLEDYDAGCALMDDALKSDPNLLGIYTEKLSILARYFEEDGDTSRAEAIYRRLMKDNTDKPFFQFKLAEVLFMQGQHDESLELCKSVLRFDPEFRDAANLLDALYSSENNPDEHIHEWRTLCEVMPDSILPYLHLGKTLEQYGKIEDSHAVYEKALQHTPENAVIKIRYGIVSALIGNYEEGRKAIDEALMAAPELSADAAAGLAKIAEHAGEEGKPDLAESCYRDAIRLAPTDFWHQVHFGEFLMKQSRLDEAEKIFVQVLMARPESPQTALLLDDLYLQQKKDEARINTWKAITENHPEADVPRRHFEMAIEYLNEQ